MENSSKWIKYYDKIYSLKDYEGEVSFIKSFVNNFKNKAVLDVGCGTGNHSIRMSNYFREVVGIDPSKEMIKIARSKKGNGNCLFRECYIKDLEREILFDTIVSMFGVLNYFESYREVISFIEEISARTKKGGIFIFDIWNLVSPFVSCPLSIERKVENLIYLCIPKVDDTNMKVILQNSVTDLSKGETIKYDICVNLWQTNLLSEILGQNKFEAIGIFKAFDKEILSSSKDYKIVFVCRRT